MSIAKRFGANVKRARTDAGVSQEEVGVRASLHRTEIGLLERGERLPRIDTAIKLAGAVGRPLGELLIGIEWTPGSTQAGEFTVSPPSERRRAVLERAAAFRAGQAEETDVAGLAREAREELEERGGS